MDVEAVETWGNTLDSTIELSLLAGVLNEVDNTTDVIFLLGVLKNALGPDWVIRSIVFLFLLDIRGDGGVRIGLIRIMSSVNINMTLMDISNLMDINVRGSANIVTVDNWTGAVAGVLAMEIVLLGMGRTILLDGSMMGLGTVLLRCID